MTTLVSERTTEQAMVPTASSAILVPLDGSTEAEQAVPYAQALVPPDGELLLLRVVRGLEAFDVWRSSRLADEPVQATAEDVATSYLMPIAERLRQAGINAQIAVTVGDPAEEILRIAEDRGVELVVMTTHGRGAMGRILFGSVADRVARHGTRPTLLLRSHTPYALPDRLVVPLDGSPLAEEALPVASRVAGRLGVSVRLVRIVDLDAILHEIWLDRHQDLFQLPKDEAYREARARCERAAAAYLADQGERLQKLGVATEWEVQTGTPVFALLDLLRPGDLLVMTSHGLGGVRRWWIGSVAEKLVREATVPVLLVRPDQDAVVGHQEGTAQIK